MTFFSPPPHTHKIYILFETEGGGVDVKYSDALHLENLNVEVFGWIYFTYFDMQFIEFQTSLMLVRKACGRTLTVSHWDNPERKKGNILFHFLFLHHTWGRTFKPLTSHFTHFPPFVTAIEFVTKTRYLEVLFDILISCWWIYGFNLWTETCGNFEFCCEWAFHFEGNLIKC